MRLFVSAILIAVLASCSNLPPVEFCYVHPVYGQVCVSVGGKRHYREDLTVAQRAEVDKWIAESGGK